MGIILSIAFLAVGFIIGFLGQNSRMCFIGGFRDFLFVRDTALLQGLLIFLASTWFFIFIIRLAGLVETNYPAITEIFFSSFGVITLGGGFFLGFISTLSGACPMRHHIQFGQGRMDSGFFFIGFYAGIVLFYSVIVKILPV